MELNYEEIRRIYRLEKNSSQLIDLDENFYVQLSAFIEKEKKAYLDSLKNGSFTDAKNFTNLKKLVEEIFFMREKKLLNKALLSSRTKEKDAKGMSVEEKKLFFELLSLLERHQEFFSALFEQNNADKKEKNFLKVKILSDVPSFIGVDMKEYGPFKAEEEAVLPQKIALLLVEKNFAQRI